jgi:small subunit ribosomal protein S6
LREYETVFVLHPSVDDKEVEAEIQAVKDLITTTGGSVEAVERWGRRRLAYQIQKVSEGTYTLVRFHGQAQSLKDLERRYRLNERLLRHLTVLCEGPLAPPHAETHGEEGAPPRREEADFEMPRERVSAPAAVEPSPGSPPTPEDVEPAGNEKT